MVEGVALIPWKLSKAIVEQPEDVTDLVQGHRPFNSATPGAIMATIFDEEQALGWAPELSYDFTATHDSDGVPWASVLTIAYTPGTTAAVVLDNLIAQGVCESANEGRTMRLFNPDHGADLSIGDDPVRVGGSATSMPVKRSINELLTDVVLFGEDGISLAVNNPAAVTGLGALRAAISQGGVSDPGTMALLAQARLVKGESIKTQISAKEAAETAAALPWIDYLPGDWVEALYRGEWPRLRIAELVVQKDLAGTITITPILNDRFLDLLSRLAKRTAGIVGGALAGGTGAIPNNGEDRRKPKVPEGLVVESNGYWSDGGVPLSQIGAAWTAVTQGENDVAIGVALYELWGRVDNGADESGVLTSSVTNAASWSPFTPGEDWLIKVRAQSANGVWGEFSDEVAVTMERPTFTLEKPTAPQVSSYDGVVEVVWPGTFDTDPPTFPPQHFAQINVEMSPDQFGDDYALVGTLFAGSERTSLIGLGNGSVWWFRFVAIDRLGRPSEPSDATSVVVLGIDGAHLIVNSVTSDSIDVGAIMARHIGADVSGAIDLTATQGFSVVIGQITAVADGLSGTAGELADLRQRYDFTPTALVIRQPGSTVRVELDNDSMGIYDGATQLLELAGGTVTADQFVGRRVILGAHKLEAAPSPVLGTVVRTV